MGLLACSRSNWTASFVGFFITIGFFGGAGIAFGAISSSTERRQTWLLSESGQETLTAEDREDLRKGCVGSVEAYCRKLIARNTPRAEPVADTTDEGEGARVESRDTQRRGKKAVRTGKTHQRKKIVSHTGKSNKSKSRRHAAHRKGRGKPRG